MDVERVSQAMLKAAGAKKALSSNQKEELKKAHVFILEEFQRLNQEILRLKAFNFDAIVQSSATITSRPSDPAPVEIPEPEPEESLIIQPSEGQTVEALYADIVTMKPRSELGLELSQKVTAKGIVIRSKKKHHLESLKTAMKDKGFGCKFKDPKKKNPLVVFKNIPKDQNPVTFLNDICEATAELQDQKSQFKFIRVASFKNSNKYNLIASVSSQAYLQLKQTERVYLQWGQGFIWRNYIMVTQCQTCWSFDHGTRDHAASPETYEPGICFKCQGIKDEKHECGGKGVYCPNCQQHGHPPNTPQCLRYRMVMQKEMERIDYTSGKATIEIVDEGGVVEDGQSPL